MNIWIPVVLVSAIGLIAGLILAVVSKIFAVPVNEKVEQVRDLLPGANCGGCGFSGCDGYAAAVAEGADTNLCTAGGADTAAAVAKVMGVEPGAYVPKVSVVRCSGTDACAGTKFDYAGFPSCAAMVQLDNGPWMCRFSCLGLGDCVKACEVGALSVDHGIAHVNEDLCIGCGKCVQVCPHEILAVIPKGTRAVHCRNMDKGAVTRKVCTAGCLGCGKCARTCEAGAITMEEGRAVINPALCTGCGACEEGCPTKVIHKV